MQEFGRGIASDADQTAVCGLTLHSDVVQPLEVIERSRRRLAFDLHDGPAQSISAALLQLEILEGYSKSAARVEDVTRLRKLLQEALEEILNLAGELRSVPFDGAGFEIALGQFVDKVKSRTNMQVYLEIDGEVAQLTSSARIAVFRIVQEALTNAFRHGHANCCRVNVGVDEEMLSCLIADDGCGFDIEATLERQNGDHFGLKGMAERASLLDGQLTVVSIPGEGTTVLARIPRWRA